MMPEFNSNSLVALFSVTKSYGEFLKNEASHNVPDKRGLYEATRGKWQISPEKREEIKYAAAAYTAPGSPCEIVQVYRVHNWYTAGTSEKYKTRPELNEEAPGFWEFDGTPADDAGKKLIGCQYNMNRAIKYERLGELLNLSNTPPKEDSMIDTAIELLRQFYQIIFHGPPGTGKTHCAKQLLPELLESPNSTPQQLRNEGRWDIVQFHPSYNYEDFVRGVQVKTVPVKGNDGKADKSEVSYETLNRVFGKICKKAAADDSKTYALIIDEINRANVSAVLGELIYALEYRGEPINTPYDAGDGKALTIPKNLYVIGTMNTADRTIGQIDYAVRRRFAFVACPPDKSVVYKKDGEEVRKIYDKVQALFGKTGNGGFLSSDFDAADVCIGHSYFLPSDKRAKNPLHQIAQKIIWQVVPILREYVKDGILQDSEKLQEAIAKIEEDAENLPKKPLADESVSDSSANNQNEKGAKFYWRNGDRFGVGGVGRTALGVITDFIKQRIRMSANELRTKLEEGFEPSKRSRHKRIILASELLDKDKARYFRDSPLRLDNGEVVLISAEWGATGQSLPQWNAFKKKMKEQHGYSIGQCYLVNLGEGESRSLVDSRKFGFVSARNSLRSQAYETQINKIEKGDFLFINWAENGPGGYVGYGEVVGKAVHIGDFKPDNKKPLADCDVGDGTTYQEKYPSAFDEKRPERVLRVKWGKQDLSNKPLRIGSAPGEFYRGEIRKRAFHKLRKAFDLPGYDT